MISQTATFTPFSNPTPATSRFDKFRFKHGDDEHKKIVFSSSFIEPKFLKQKVVSSAEAVYRKVVQKNFILLISLLFLTIVKGVSRHNINNNRLILDHLVANFFKA